MPSSENQLQLELLSWEREQIPLPLPCCSLEDEMLLLRWLGFVSWASPALDCLPSELAGEGQIGLPKGAQ